MSSINDKLERVRKPRVHIKYDVETEDGVIQKELPFVVGVMGDFSGDGTALSKPLKERKFVKIDRDSFNEVMAKQNAGLNFKVENTLLDDGSQMSVELEFNAMEDFEPANIVAQVPSLKKLKDIRDKLRDLLSKSDRSDQLEKILEEALQDPTQLDKLASELGIDKGE